MAATRARPTGDPARRTACENALHFVCARAEEAQLHACTAGSITLHMSLVLRCFHLLPACFGLVLDALGERSVRDAPQEKGIDMLEDEAADDWFPSPRVREFATKDACGGAERGRRSTDLWVSESCR